MSKRVGNGKTTMFWYDPWVDGEALNRHYYTLFMLNEFQAVMDVQVLMENSKDFWVLLTDNSGSYIVSSAYKILLERNNFSQGAVYRL